jgi:subtilisin family serine protease
MKNTLLSCLLLMGTLFSALAQTGFEAHNLALDLKHKPGEVIVKFKDELKINFTKSNELLRTGLSTVDQAFEKWSVSSGEQVFRASRYERNAGTIRFPDGTEKPIPQFHNIFLMKYPEKFNPEQVAEELNKLEEVEYAEVNATAFIHGLIPVSEPFKAEDLGDRKNHSERSLVPNDPLYDQQWYLPEVKADQMWDTLTGDSTQVIAILDTGVDWLHPDLVNKIGTNPNETIDGQDSDGNGFVDDLRGWDFVNNDNNPMDDNSHGTHCAGIAAAESDNGIGIAGVSWGAKIMPVKIFQSNGVGYVNQIAEGIWYAAQNGANIFSNSWGGYGESITVRLAFEYAYSKGPIIAAAGNDNYKIDHPTPPFPMTAPMFPASYNWVLGVEATSLGSENAWFSNFDPTGPVISDGRPYGSIFYNDSEHNYEVRAPGVSLISTVPNGQYRYYSGTSMAAPVVAGAVALMRSYNPNLSIEQIFSKLIQPLKINTLKAGILDVYTATLTNPPADIYFQSHSIVDTLNDCDFDGRPDAGETIEIYISAKNAGGPSNQIVAKLRFPEFEDTTTALILKDTCSIGSLSSYASNWSHNPFKIKLDSNLVHQRIIRFDLLVWEVGSLDTAFAELTLSIENGIEINGAYSYLRLKPNTYYIINEPTIVDTLIIDPGVILRFSGGWLSVISEFHAVGKPDSLITFRGAPNSMFTVMILGGSCNSEVAYCLFTEGGTSSPMLSGFKKIYNSIFKLNAGVRLIAANDGEADYRYNVFTENSDDYYYFYYLIDIWGIGSFKYNLVVGNELSNLKAPIGVHQAHQNIFDSINHNVFMSNNDFDFKAPEGLSMMHINDNYWGTVNLQEIRNNIVDYFENPGAVVLEPTEILEAPPAEAHGVVWKVEINHQNPQEGNMDALGVGPMRVDVFFNRPMDTLIEPFVTFGVRFPYTQNIVTDIFQGQNDSIGWSEDGMVWTGYHFVDISTGDGENTIRVARARDTDHFEIPIERSRFKFVIQAAGSQSVNFNATPGIGKVSLEWPLSDSTNVLGYNLYRYRMINDSTLSDTLALNEGPLADSTYIDYAVIPDSTYYYLFTAMLTDFTESDYSKVVSATPFSAANGDANGDLTVNVLDITTIVNYILNQNPQPFLSDAADVNYDGQINLLDIIGVVNLIMDNKAVSDRPYPMISQQKAYYEWRGNQLWLHSQGNVAGLQFDLALPENLEAEQLRIKSRLPGFEMASQIQAANILGLLYSLDGKTIPAGESCLLELIGADLPAELQFNTILGGELEGDLVEVLPYGIDDLPEQGTEQQVLRVQPNPFSHQLLISWDAPQANKVALHLYDQQGRLIKSLYEGNDVSGNTYWEGKDQHNKSVSKGVYILRMELQQKEGLQSVERKVIFR